MADHYALFSEIIDGITPEEAEWLETLLLLDPDEPDQLTRLRNTLLLGNDAELDLWPHFQWELKGARTGRLWLYSDEAFSEDHLIWFVQAFIRQHRPNYIFGATVAAACSKPRPGEFGGLWLVVSADEVMTGNTWDAAEAAAEALSPARPPRPSYLRDNQDST